MADILFYKVLNHMIWFVRHGHISVHAALSDNEIKEGGNTPTFCYLLYLQNDTPIESFVD